MAFRFARTLLASAPSAGAKKSTPFVKNWLSDSATYPIMIIMAGAMGLVAYQGQRLLLSHPDITFDKDDRSSFIRDNDDAAEHHHEHGLRKYARKGNTQIMPGINNVMVQGKVKQ